MVIFQPRQKAGVNFTIAGDASSTNSKLGYTDKHKINYAERPSDTEIVDKNMHKCMALDEPLTGL